MSQRSSEQGYSCEKKRTPSSSYDSCKSKKKRNPLGSSSPQTDPGTVLPQSIHFQPMQFPSMQSQPLSSSSFQKDQTNTNCSSQTDGLIPTFSSATFSKSTITSSNELEDLKKKYERVVEINQNLQFQLYDIKQELEKEKEERIKWQSTYEQNHERMRNAHANLCKLFVDLGNVITALSNNGSTSS
ncbi:hypothetical protein C9374_013339 [Naegleria lovaniensis]|uniref:Uncharacterized protein n=1 Tax=Naegleria lovaniensis TaxID=51637 RepID=A0AA88KQJ5_NAELO|nr:uncharacterized protein C9374_013339 [Naegleria lovaniensis]KAG2391854.1 hypothetical protein C9374_013339 [Naegleria lovaniensis]